jgi:hypothetical protein
VTVINNPETGMATAFVDVLDTPEPASLVLAAVGIVGLVGRQRWLARRCPR